MTVASLEMSDEPNFFRNIWMQLIFFLLLRHGRRKYTAGLMLKFNEEKLAKLRTFDDVLQEKYGEPNSEARKDFDARAKAWYYAELLKDERKKQKMTQKALAEKIGKKREYVSALEKGQTDMQLSTFLRIANALGLQFSLVVG